MTVTVRIFSDFTCPFCYIGSGIIEELKHEFDFQEEWVSYELHPETPKEGVLLADRFPDRDLDALRRSGKSPSSFSGRRTMDERCLSGRSPARDLSGHDLSF